MNNTEYLFLGTIGVVVVSTIYITKTINNTYIKLIHSLNTTEIEK